MEKVKNFLMAYAGQTITHPSLGTTVRFTKTHKETNGLGWEAEYYIEPKKEKAKEAHIHLHSDEWFIVLQGQCKYHLDGKTYKAVAGDEIFLPAGKPHIHPWNTGKNKLIMRNVMLMVDGEKNDKEQIKMIEDYMEHWFFLASRGQVRKDGKPYTLQSAVFFEAIKNQIVTATIPMFLQKICIAPLAFAGRLKGYTRAVYE